MHGTLVSMLYVAAWQKNLFENEVYMTEDIQRKSFTLDTLATLAKWLSVLLRTKVVVIQVQLMLVAVT